MPRINVYVDATTRKLIDRHKRRLNLSAIFTQAVQRECEILKTTKGTKAMSKVIERLKREAATEEEQAYVAAKKVGREWAEDHAEIANLRLMEQAADCDFATNSVDAAFGNRVAEMMQEHFDEYYDDEVFEEELGRDAWENCRSQVMNGFVAGALEVWDAVKDKL